MRAILVALGLSLVLTGSAFAQQDARPPGEIAQYADQLIAGAGAQDIFVLEGTAPPGAMFLRHSASGMRCILAISYAPALSVASSDARIPRGDDVSCSERGDDFTVSTHATRFPDRPSLDAALQRATAALLSEHPEAEPIDISTLPTMPGGAPAPRSQSAGYLIRVNGAERFIRISMYAAGDWIYALRLDAPAVQLNAIGDYTWRNLLTDLARHQTDAPGRPTK